jgi:lipopolysaccharide heptosyltransferase II
MIDAAWQSVRKLLLIRLDNLGDVLLMTPAFHALKAALPDASLTLLTSSAGAQVGKLDPDIDEVIVYAAPWIDPWQQLPHDSAREQRMIAQLRARQFDAAVIFTSFRQSALPAAFLCYLADIPLRLAASIDGPGSLLTTRHKHPERMMHEVERALDLVGAINVELTEQDLVIRVPNDAVQAMRNVLVQEYGTRRPLIVVHPGCTMPARTYPWEMYAEVINLLAEQLQATIAVTGGKDERALVEQIIECIRPELRTQTLALAGTLPFASFCGLIQDADLVVTNNTGPMHIAAALKTPVVALFALTNPPEQWGPWRVAHRLLYQDVPCRICYSRVCPYQHECLRLVSPQMVVDAARAMLSETGERTMEVLQESVFRAPTLLSELSVGQARGEEGSSAIERAS